MAGVVLQNPNLVWQKVKNYLSAINSSISATATTGSCPAIQNAFLDLKNYMSQDKRNITLQLIPFSAEDVITAAGYLPLGAGACTIYGIYAKGRRTSATTLSVFQIFDASDNTGAAPLFTRSFNAAGQEFCYIDGVGLPIATELCISNDTAVGGQTESTAALSCDGFVIVGA